MRRGRRKERLATKVSAAMNKLAYEAAGENILGTKRRSARNFGRRRRGRAPLLKSERCAWAAGRQHAQLYQDVRRKTAPSAPASGEALATAEAGGKLTPAAKTNTNWRGVSGEEKRAKGVTGGRLYPSLRPL